jgi:hypothetical protein
VEPLKPGRHRPRLLELLRETGRADDVMIYRTGESSGGTHRQTLCGYPRHAGIVFRVVFGSAGRELAKQ